METVMEMADACDLHVIVVLAPIPQTCTFVRCDVVGVRHRICRLFVGCDYCTCKGSRISSTYCSNVC